jgi:predicted Zn-dependent protease
VAHLGRGAYDDALELFEQIAADVPADSIGPLGVVQAHAMAGRTSEAHATFDALRERFGEARVGPYRMAIAFSRLGEPDAAFAGWIAPRRRTISTSCAWRSIRRSMRCAMTRAGTRHSFAIACR